MTKSLTDKLVKGVKNTILLGTAVGALFLAGCNFPIKNSKPSANLSVSPTSGQTTLTSSINLNGSDSDGRIMNYTVQIDNNEDGTINQTISQSSPINISKQFNVSSYIYGQVTDSSGMTSDRVKETVTVTNPNPIQDYVDISGWLEDDETHIGQMGNIKILDSSNAPVKIKSITTGTSVDDYTVKTNSGDFSLTLNQLVSQSSNETLKAEMVDASGNPTSYVRTVSIPQADQNSVTVRVVPFDSTVGISDFISFVQDVNTKYLNNKLGKFYIPNIEVVQTSPLDGSSFPDPELIRQKAQEWSDIITNYGLITNRQKIIVIPTTTSGIINGRVDPTNSNRIISNPGWEIVAPFIVLPYSLQSGSQGGTERNRGTVEAEGNAVSYISVSNTSAIPLQELSSHEIGLAESFVSESTSFSPLQTISNHYVSITSPTKLDKKYTLLDYEETYSDGEDLGNILGTSF